MLGVHRPGVTVAVNALQRRGIIQAKRGRIIVMDRHTLEEAAHGFYGRNTSG